VADLVLLRLVHLRVRLAFVLKARVPAFHLVSIASRNHITVLEDHLLTENSRPPTRHQLPVRTSLERNRLVARTLAVPECAHCLCGLVVEAREHLVQFEGSEGEHEPFAVAH
jgi:hypothetical protein